MEAFERAWALLKEETRQLWGGDLDKFTAFRAVPKSAIPDILEHGVEPRSLDRWGDQIWHDSGIKIDPYDNKGSWWFTHTPRFKRFNRWFDEQREKGDVHPNMFHPLLMATYFMSQNAPWEGTGEFKRNLRGTDRAKGRRNQDYHAMRDLFDAEPKALWNERKERVPMGIVGVKGRLPGKHWRDREGFPAITGSPSSAVLTTKPVPADMLEEVEPFALPPTESEDGFSEPWWDWMREHGQDSQFKPVIDEETGRVSQGKWV